jgi:GT2 family glycosyltransferase
MVVSAEGMATLIVSSAIRSLSHGRRAARVASDVMGDLIGAAALGAYFATGAALLNRGSGVKRILTRVSTVRGSGVMPALRDIICVCTRNRAGHVAELLGLLAEQNNARPLLIVDSSDTDELRELATDPAVTYIHTEQRSLARQRNIALDCAAATGYQVIHFLDDDTRPEPGYFDSLEAALRGDLAGVGGVVTNQSTPKYVTFKRLFALSSNEPGRVLRSGRATIGHYPGDGGGPVQWLPGCAMSYRLDRLDGQHFDARLEAYSYGEDKDFSFRLSRRHPLEIVPAARCEHLEAPENRYKACQLARERTSITRRWVREQHDAGLESHVFWWSVLGEVLLRTAEALVKPRHAATSLAVARGVLEGARQRL